MRRILAIATPIALLTGGMLAATSAAADAATATTAATSATGSSHWEYACGTFTRTRIHCLVIKNTAAHPTAQTVRPNAIPSGEGYGPSTFQSAYGLTAASAADGSGTTVAVVDAYNDPTAERPGDIPVRRGTAGPDVWAVHPVQPGRRDLAAAGHGPG